MGHKHRISPAMIAQINIAAHPHERVDVKKPFTPQQRWVREVGISATGGLRDQENCALEYTRQAKRFADATHNPVKTCFADECENGPD